MAALRALRARPARPGSLTQPISGRTYRGTWLLVAIPLLIAAFSVRTPDPLPPPALPTVFDRAAAVDLADDFARSHPKRRPDTETGRRASAWVVDNFERYGLRPQVNAFLADVFGLGRVRLENLVAVVPGQSPDAIVVMAHRDDTGDDPGANDNASGTAVLLELARSYESPTTVCVGEAAAQGACPIHTIVLLSTDGGAFGGIGAERFADSSPYRDRIVAVVNLDSLAGDGEPRLEFGGDSRRSASPTLVRTAARRILEQVGDEPERASGLWQLVELAFPFSPYEHAPFVSRGAPAITVTTMTRDAERGAPDTPADLNAARLGQLGVAAQALVGSLDRALEFGPETPSYLYLGSRVVPGWAVELVLFGALLPFFAAAVDLFARVRRRRVSLAPAWRSLRSRLAFWLWSGALFGLFAVLGVWTDRSLRPPSPGSQEAGDWPVLGVLGLGVLAALGWFVARERLLPRRVVSDGEQLAGYTVALLALGVVALLVVAINPFALVFLLPALHAWVWLPNLRDHSPLVRTAVFLAGLGGPLLLVTAFADRFGTGLDTPWYVALLVSLGEVPIPLVLTFLAWLAVGGQIAALTTGRYAPYPSGRERPPRGPVREVVRRVLLAAGAGRSMRDRGAEEEAAL